jgi:hypothetical protein
MKIVEDNGSSDIVIEFQDEYKYRKHTQYCNFKSGSIRNPYCPSIYGIGITGCKYPTKTEINDRPTKEYSIWRSILERSFVEKIKEKQPTYKNVACCDEWINFENFYEWLHSQPNFDKWYNGKRWAVDKDILIKGNKLYSPETCRLVPQNVNCLFLKREAERGSYPIGVHYTEDGFVARCRNPFLDTAEDLGCYSTPEKAFQAYKVYKGDIIKQVAEVEYKAGNITEECYQAMMEYEVEIDD